MAQESPSHFYLSQQAKRYRYLLLIITVLICALIIGCTYLYVQYEEKTLARDKAVEVERISSLLLQQTEEVYREASQVVDRLYLEIKDRKIESEQAYQQYASSLATHQFMKRSQSKSPFVDGAIYAANDGKILNTVRYFPPTQVDNISAREAFRHFSQHNDLATLYTAPVLAGQDNTWRLGVARRVNGKDSRFLGVVSAGILVHSLTAYYAEAAAKLGNGVAISLYRKSDNVTLAHYPENEAILDKKNAARLTTKSGFSNDRSNYFVQSKEFPLVLSVSTPLDFGLENHFERQSWVYSGAGMIVLITILLSYLLYRSFYEAQKYQYLSGMDELTHIPNKAAAHHLLKQSLAAAKRNSTKLALVYIDLNRFKQINDTAGHNVGDLVLEETAKRIRGCYRASDSVCRDGGDEFVVILPDIQDAQSAVAIAQKVHDAISIPMEFGGQTYSVGASIGVALYPEHGTHDSDLWRNADSAMYTAKKANLDGVYLFRSWDQPPAKSYSI